MKKIIAYVLSAVLCILACMALLNELNSECVLLCGILVSINCLIDISERNLAIKTTGYLLIILAVIAGFIMSPLIPALVSFVILITLNLCELIEKATS